MMMTMGIGQLEELKIGGSEQPKISLTKYVVLYTMARVKVSCCCKSACPSHKKHPCVPVVCEGRTELSPGVKLVQGDLTALNTSLGVAKVPSNSVPVSQDHAGSEYIDFKNLSIQRNHWLG